MDKEVKEALFQFKRSIAINYEMGMTSISNERNIIILKYIDDLQQRIDKAVEYIEKYLHEHVIDDLPDEESKFEYEDGVPIPNAKEILLNILKGDDINDKN